MPRAKGPWALDSGGFTEVTQFGEWRTTEAQYVSAVRHYADEIGGLEWAAPMDWMCEPFALEATGLTLGQHQLRTVTNLLRLRDAAPEIHFIPVLQGWELPDYEHCIRLYSIAGIDLKSEPIVGVGSVCRRQANDEIKVITGELAAHGLAIHGFGVKARGLTAYHANLASADSMAWSYNARRNPPLPGCTHAHCNNCFLWAMRWRDRLLEKF